MRSNLLIINNRLTLGFVVVIGLSLLFAFMSASKVSAAYDAGRIIDDSVFLDAKSMSINEVQNFLVARGSGLKDMTFNLQCYGTGSQERQWYTAAGARCDTPIPASEIIYYAAQVYGVSPKVILTTMQKEQSLTTAANPTSWQLNQAMGYACPTSGSCESSSSFPYQIDSGTWALRFHYERARGNMNWWYTSSSWTCGTEKSLYKPSLYPGQDVRFYDTNGTHYATVYIQNAATSTMYCYTPHAYNNPQGLYGRASYGTTGLYYSGSYNFVYYYELWFGTTMVPHYAARQVGQTPSELLNVQAGKSTPAYIQFENRGNKAWYDDISAPLNSERPVRLGTDLPLNRASNFMSDRPQSNRPSVTFGRVYNADGSLAVDQHVVQPGQIAEFWFAFNVPVTQPSGTYQEGVRPIVEGYGAMNDTGTYFTLVVQGYDFKAEKIAASTDLWSNAGGKANAYIKYKNTGSSPWYDSVSAATYSQLPVRLATDIPLNRTSVFGSDWPWAHRPSVTFGRVYNADGSLAVDQHVVQPGQIAEFWFAFNVPVTQPSGTYQEGVRPIVEGYGAMNDTANTTIRIHNQGSDYKAAWAGQSSVGGSKAKGSKTSAYIKYKNTGSSPWYDSVSAATYSQLPVRLATDIPLNRTSVFGSDWPWAHRPSVTFGRVYNADGSLAVDQHVVQPGQIAEFWFAFNVPVTQPSGTYQEGVRPIVEGYGAMNDTGTYFTLVVQ